MTKIIITGCGAPSAAAALASLLALEGEFAVVAQPTIELRPIEDVDTRHLIEPRDKRPYFRRFEKRRR